MRLVKFLLVAALTSMLIYFLDISFKVNGQGVPPMGRFLNSHSGFWQNAEGKYPSLATHLSNTSLKAPVEVLYDDRMVPHVFAENTEDVLFAQGYVTASMRLWQMEFQTHAAAGRLSELIGYNPRVLAMDLEQRRIGMLSSAESTVAHWKENPQIWSIISRYTDGVNAYIQSLSPAEYPLEYKILHYEPELWTPLKTALLLKYMAKDLTYYDEDIERTNAYTLLGETVFKDLYAPYFEKQSPVVPDTSFAFTPIAIPALPVDSTAVDSSLGGLVPHQIEYNHLEGIGSNNWAVSGKKTKSGRPMLCNDPHLTLRLPSIWFEIQLHTPDFNAYGATLPGAPCIISGFNTHIAWGITNVSQDVLDWYTVDWVDKARTKYRLDGEIKDAELRIEAIKVRDSLTVYDTVRYTVFGPVAFSDPAHPKYDMAMKWLAHSYTEEPLAVLGLLQAKNYKDYVAAVSHFGSPPQNFIFAAKDGDIAIRPQGKLPLRRPEQGMFVQSGTTRAHDWQGFIPQAHIATSYNPARGFVASANQHSTTPDYPYFYGGSFEEYRGRYLNARLENMQDITWQDMRALQNDNFSQKAKDFLPYFIKNLKRATLTREELEVLAVLEPWDYQSTKESTAPAIFYAWFDAFEQYLYDEIDSLRTTANVSLHYPEEWFALRVVQSDTNHTIVDRHQTPDIKEGISDIITLSFKAICANIPMLENGKYQTWGEVQNTHVDHLGYISVFSRKDIDTHGDRNALNAIGPTSGPSWRMIVELGETPKAEVVYPGGQSGNPGSRFYDNMLETWSAGNYYEALFLTQPDSEHDRVVYTQHMTH